MNAAPTAAASALPMAQPHATAGSKRRSQTAAESFDQWLKPRATNPRESAPPQPPAAEGPDPVLAKAATTPEQARLGQSGDAAGEDAEAVAAPQPKAAPESREETPPTAVQATPPTVPAPATPPPPVLAVALPTPPPAVTGSKPTPALEGAAEDATAAASGTTPVLATSISEPAGEGLAPPKASDPLSTPPTPAPIPAQGQVAQATAPGKASASAAAGAGNTTPTLAAPAARIAESSGTAAPIAPPPNTQAESLSLDRKPLAKAEGKHGTNTALLDTMPRPSTDSPAIQAISAVAATAPAGDRSRSPGWGERLGANAWESLPGLATVGLPNTTPLQGTPQAAATGATPAAAQLEPTILHYARHLQESGRSWVQLDQGGADGGVGLRLILRQGQLEVRLFTPSAEYGREVLAGWEWLTRQAEAAGIKLTQPSVFVRRASQLAAQFPGAGASRGETPARAQERRRAP